MKKYLALLLLLTAVNATITAQNGFLPENLEVVNSEYEEANPVLSPDGNTLYFMRINHYKNKYGIEGSQDIWFSTIDPNGNFTEPQRASDSLNIAQYNSLFAVTKDGNSFLINGVFNKNGTKWLKRGLSMVRKTDKGWTNPEPIKIPGYTTRNEGYFSYAYMNNEETILLFSFSAKVNGTNSNLFLCTKDEKGKWSRPVRFREFNSKFDDQTPFITNDDEHIYFSSNRKDGLHNYDVYVTHRKNKLDWEEWTIPEPISDTINSSGWEAYFKINEKGNYAYYVSDFNSKGRGDIYRIKLFEDKPYILVKGAVLDHNNNPYASTGLNLLVHEPVAEEITLDSITSQFEMKLPFGKLFEITARVPDGISDTVVIDGRNINEHQVINKDIHITQIPYAIITGNIMIKGTNSIVPMANKPTVLVDGLEVDTAIIAPEESRYLLKLNTGYDYRLFVHAENFGTVLDNADLIFASPMDTIRKNLYVEDINTAMITGRILNMDTHKPIDPGIEIRILVNDHEYIKTVIPDTLYQYAINLKTGASYTLNATTPNYLPVTEYINLTNEKGKVKIMKDLNLVPVEVGKAVKLDNIFFETGSAKLKEESFPELNRVIIFMLDNPKAKIEISGHTDSQGSEALNQKLSENRAKSVVNHILLSGVPKDNIIYKGYGELMPVATNATRAGRALNRRVEFKVLEMK